MGDVLSLIEKAEQGLDKEESERLAQRMATPRVHPRGPARSAAPAQAHGPALAGARDAAQGRGLGKIDPSKVDESQLVRIEAIIDSMTPKERQYPKLLSASRKKRIARGSGTRVQDINQLLKQYRMMQRMMKNVKGGWLKKLGG